MCCNGSRTVKKQTVERQRENKQVMIKQIRRSSSSTGSQDKQIIVARQYVVPRQKCQKCGYPTMAVNIAGRERLQCSNPNCKMVVK